MIVKYKICCFIGHRKIVVDEEGIARLKNLIEYLIVVKKFGVFLFGSRSEFNDLCYNIVTELKKKYPHIKRVFYTCKSEVCVLEKDKEKWNKLYTSITKQDGELMTFDEEFEHKTKYTSGRASYVERNMAMIDDSDFCVIYYKENYLPNTRKYVKKDISSYQPKSGTKLAYDYVKQKKKDFVNIAE